MLRNFWTQVSVGYYLGSTGKHGDRKEKLENWLSSGVKSL